MSTTTEPAAAAPEQGTGEVLVRRSTPEDDAARDAFVMGAPGASFFHQSGWRRVIERTFGYEPRDLIALRGDRVVGVLPLMRCPATLGLLGRPAWISMPFAVYGGPCGVDADVERALVVEAQRQSEAERVGRLELRCIEPPAVEGLAASELYATFVKDLPDDPADVLAQMPKKARAEVRKARDKHKLGLVEGI